MMRWSIVSVLLRNSVNMYGVDSLEDCGAVKVSRIDFLQVSLNIAADILWQ
jgi:hypothetical protein